MHLGGTFTITPVAMLAEHYVDWETASVHQEDEKGRSSDDLRLDCQGVGRDTRMHHQASISEMLHLQQHGWHRERHHLDANDGDSDIDLLYPDSDKELSAVFDEESIDEDFLGFSCKASSNPNSPFQGHQNLISSSLSHSQPVHEVSSESVHNFLRYPAVCRF